MPRGYYLGQGLIPLGYSSSDDEEGPCELPNGRIVCGPHGLVICGKCCTDYTGMGDDSDDDDDEGWDADEHVDDEPNAFLGDLLPRMSSGFGKVKGTGKAFPSKFVPSSSNKKPLEEFSNRHQHIGVIR